jgi:radical SAM superfamily enzyme YgiQ (UPF0313 family)
MDALPVPGWDGFVTTHHYAPYRGKLMKTALVEFSRTCPYNCAYCGNGILRNLYLKSGIKISPRHKSPAKFIADLKYLKQNYGIEFVSITDGTFLTFPTPVLEELVKLYKEEINLPFFIDTTVTSITRRRVELLKEMGCICVNMGVENGDEDYRRELLLRNISNKSIINAFRIIQEVGGIETRAYNIIGLPLETRKDIFKTIELNRKCKPHSTSLAIFVPFPGTWLREFCIEKGLMDKDLECIGDGTVPNIKSDSISESELMGIYNTFFLYIKAPKIMFPLIRLCEKDNWLSRKLRRLLIGLFSI